MKKLRTGRKKTNYKVLTRMLFATAAFAYALPHWIFCQEKVMVILQMKIILISTK